MFKWFERFKKDKHDKKDFTLADLPDNRFDQFFDVIKTRFTGLLTLNLLYLMFVLPMLLIFLWIFIIALPEWEVAYPTKDPLENLITYLNGFLLICIPLNAIAGPATAGAHYVLRNWSWGEHARAGADFWMEFKRSWKTSAVYNALSSMLIYACFFWICNAMGMPNSVGNALPEYVRFIIAGVVGIVLVLYLLTDVYVYPLMVTFKLNFKQLLKNALLLALARIPQTIGYLLGCALFIVLVCLLWQVTTFALVIIGFVLVFLAKMLLANSAFDKFNHQLTGGKMPTRRGLAPKKDKLGRVIKD